MAFEQENDIILNQIISKLEAKHSELRENADFEELIKLFHKLLGENIEQKEEIKRLNRKIEKIFDVLNNKLGLKL